MNISKLSSAPSSPPPTSFALINIPGNRDYCRELFIKMEILHFHSQYIFSLLLYIVNNKHLFNINIKFHKYGTRSNTDFHLPLVNLTKFHTGPYYSEIKMFSHLPD